jgi:hypothetical protein
MANTADLPKRIYVKRETDTDEKGTYLLADEDVDSIEHGETVGIYELVETKRMHVTRELK